MADELSVSPDALLVFTIEPPDLILKEGATQYWKLRDWRARECQFIVCVQNQNAGDKDWCKPTEPHKTAFIIGHIADVVPSEIAGRFKVKLRDFCRINVPDVWRGWRFPVRYTTLADVGIDPADLVFEPIPPPDPPPEAARARLNEEDHSWEAEVRPLSLAQVKQGLAATLGVRVDAIEITIKA